MGGIHTIDFILPLNNLFIYVVAISAKWKIYFKYCTDIFVRLCCGSWNFCEFMEKHGKRIPQKK